MRFDSFSGFLVVMVVVALVLGVSAPGWADQGAASGEQIKGLRFFQPLPAAVRDAAPETQARAYLSAHASELGLAPDLAGLRLEEVQESPIGLHFTFRQHADGVPMQHAGVAVTIDLLRQRVHSVHFNVSTAADQLQVPEGALLSDEAMDRAWSHLRVHGELMDWPTTELMWRRVQGSWRLVWNVRLDVRAPYGYWNTAVAAATGEVLSVRSAIVCAEARRHAESTADFASYNGPVTSRTEAIERYSARMAEEEEQQRTKTLVQADGTALVFDPDPRTELLDETLEDNSPASAFDGAYVTRTLRDLTVDGGTYHLDGPYVRIWDTEPPETEPSTSASGSWTAQRGNNAFNDVMVYFHVDQNQRYLQSLGFYGVQEGPIVADSDARDGDDNSAFIAPSRLVFGRGCVDDAEDADTILHEYGHAIHYAIRRLYLQDEADTGGISEGFADYWAGSYSYRTGNGAIFHPEWVFDWEGHNQCWGGRILNLDPSHPGHQYNPARAYGAHRPLGHDSPYSTDEFWSTPLFQSLVELVDLGQAHEEMDTIIIQSHYGVIEPPTLPEMAQVTVAAAQALFPGLPHAQVYQNQFARFGILDGPLPEPGSLHFAAATLSVDEEAGQVSLTVLRSDGTSGEVSATVSVSGGTATDSDDFVLESSSVVFADGEEEQTVVLSITSDEVAEGEETVTLELSDPTGGASLGSPTTLVVSISEQLGSDGLVPRLVVPGQARTAGSEEAFFRSAMWMTNLGDEELNLRLRYMPGKGYDGGGGAGAAIVGISPGQMFATPDVLDQVFGVTEDTSGVILVEAPAAATLPLTTARTYNDTVDGTFGQYIEAAAVTTARLGNGEIVQIDGLEAGSHARTNVGVVNLSASELAASVVLRNGSGAQAGQQIGVTVPPWTSDQVNRVNRAAGLGGIAPFAARIASASGPCLVYASRLDSVTSDPIYLTAMQARSTQWLDGIASITGSNSAYFRSSLSLTNRNDAAATVSVTFFPRGAAKLEDSTTVDVELAAGQSLLHNDVLSDLFGLTESAGWLQLTTNEATPVVAWARTYDDGSGEGTLGQFIPAIGAEDLLDTSGGVLQGLSQNEYVRTNLGLLNVSDESVDVRVTAFDRNSQQLATKVYPVAARSTVFVSRVLLDLGAGNRTETYLVVEPSASDAVSAWASYVDNNSSDQTFVRPLKVP